MARRITDKKRKEIHAYYAEHMSYSKTARKFKMSASGVRKIVLSDPECASKCKQKREENMQSVLEHMASRSEEKKELLDDLLSAMKIKARNVDMFTNIKDLGVVYGILMDHEHKPNEFELRKREVAAKEKDAGLDDIGDGKKYAGLPATSIGKAFIDLHRDIKNRKYTRFDLRGGRGSLKSSFCGLTVIDEIESNPNVCALAMRQVKDTLASSVYAQIVWAIAELGLTDDYQATTSPMQIRKKSTGQIIFLRGADDPSKIKSIKPPHGMHIGVIWLEEYDQFKSDESVRSIRQSAMRGGDDIISLYSYNTPISAAHRVNVEAKLDVPGRIIHHSHYKDAPAEWLGQAFFDDAEHLKETNERAYRHEYGGEATGSGNVVFENLVDEHIPDSLIKTFDNVLNGVDWGYYPDPWAFVRCYFHRGSMTLYIFDEAIAYKASDLKTAEIIKEKGLKDDIITTDVSQKSVDLYRFEYGLRNTVSAKKGAGSRESSYKWLQGLNKIVIDSKRCPNAYREFSSMEYLKDKFGSPITGYPDKDDHLIDAVRYATEYAWVSKLGFNTL